MQLHLHHRFVVEPKLLYRLHGVGQPVGLDQYLADWRVCDDVLNGCDEVGSG
jgi:hypothetical protein